MNKLVLGTLLSMLLFSCANEGKKTTPFESMTKEIDSLKALSAVAEEVDSFFSEEETIPVSVDESFADFFYNFVSDKRFQRSRIIFPLSCYKDKEVSRIAREEWQHDSLFLSVPVYTLLFDRAEDMEMEKDTACHSVQVDWIYLKENLCKRYYFERKGNMWHLEAINLEKIERPQGNEEDFLSFYEHFSEDSVFQRERLHKPLPFVTVDPEDDFQILETTVDEGQWFAFRPPLMQGTLTNVHYGQMELSDSKTKIMEIKGFGNGFNCVLYFERRKGLWHLVRFEDLGD